ncbi:MAG: hypothetical protein OXP08_08345 [bacterium]|nr:hypothetical protein [bacterium]
MGSGCVQRRWAFVSWAVCVALFAGGVLVPAGGAAGQDSGGVPPAGCVVALGALAAGSVVTREGSWDGGGGCRSANAGAGRAWGGCFG